MIPGRNEILLPNLVNPSEPGHFWLWEFENAAGLVVVHRENLRSLEWVRIDLAGIEGREVAVHITDAIRTPEDNAALAARLGGFTDEGGTVSRNSRHLVRYGGIAQDIVATVKATGERVSQAILGHVCANRFDWVKDDYADGHVHADNRFRAALT